MLDFKFNFRWGRFAYIGALAATIGYFFSPWAGAICLLALIDVRLDDNVFHPEETEFPDDDADAATDAFDGPYGPMNSSASGVTFLDDASIDDAPASSSTTIHMG